MRVTIMQPYFCPYAGYFRLLSATDIFVIYDDVQYSKGSWVPRNMLTRVDGKKDWMTLPLKKMPLGSKINEMQWSDDADEKWEKMKRRFKIFQEPPNNFLRFYAHYLQNAGGRMAHVYRSPVEFIVGALKASCYDLQIGRYGPPLEANMVYSSSLGIPDGLRAQDRVLWVCEKLGATEYVNAPGGSGLYSAEDFRKRGIALKIFPEYPNKTSILERLCYESSAEIKKEIDYYSEIV